MGALLVAGTRALSQVLAIVAIALILGVSFKGGAAGSADFRRIRVWRDFHYTDRGTHATGEPVRLGPSEFFVLGDNSPESRDGRDWGPVSARDIIGRPIWVLWPVSSSRALGGDLRPLVGSEDP